MSHKSGRLHKGRKFWFRVLLILLACVLIAFAVGFLVIHLFNWLLPFSAIISTLMGVVITVTILVFGFYIYFYRVPHSQRFISHAKTYIEALNLAQNLTFFMLFPFLGILINVTGDKEISPFRYAIGATLLILKSCMLIIQYAAKYYPMDEIKAKK